MKIEHDSAKGRTTAAQLTKSFPLVRSVIAVNDMYANSFALYPPRSKNKLLIRWSAADRAE